jgi:hypothetical protein
MKTTTDPLLQLAVTSRTLLIARSRATIWWFHKVVNKGEKKRSCLSVVVWISSSMIDTKSCRDIQLDYTDHQLPVIAANYSSWDSSSSWSASSRRVHELVLDLQRS